MKVKPFENGSKEPSMSKKGVETLSAEVKGDTAEKTERVNYEGWRQSRNR